MKSLYGNMMLVAAAAMSLASCSKDAAEETAAPAPQTKTITVTADVTRTQFGGDRTQLAWSKNDEFGVYTDVDTDRNIRSGTYGYAQTNNNGEFSFKVNADATEIYAYYPFYYPNNGVGNAAVYFGIPNHQKWNSLGVLTGKYIPMVASGAIEGSSVNLTFEQLGCVLALNVYGGKSGETLSSITLNTKEPSCGEVDMDIAADPVVYTPANKKALLTPFVDAEAVAVDAAAVDNQQTYASQVYLVVAKKKYAAGAEFIVVTSEKGYTFTTQAALDCTGSDFMAINLNLKNQATEPVTVRYAFGDYYSEYTDFQNKPFDLNRDLSAVFASDGTTGFPAYLPRFKAVQMWQNAQTLRGNTLTVTAANDKTITDVVFEFANNNSGASQNYLTADTGTLSGDRTVWKGSSASVVFTCNGADPDQRAYVKSITVTYE